jgi:hypothetical protein
VRHLVSLVVGLVLALVMYILLGLAVTRLRDASDGWDLDTVIAFLAALGAGAAYTALLLPRWSPLGPAVVGVILLGLTVWLFSDLASFLDTMPSDLFGIENGGVAPVGVTTAMLSVPLLATVASARRWRRTPYPAPARTAQPGYGPGPAPAPPPPAYGAPPVGVGSPAGYPGGPSLGAPYSGPPAYSSDPVGTPGYDPGHGIYGSPPPPPGGYPPEPMNPDITRRL